MAVSLSMAQVFRLKEYLLCCVPLTLLTIFASYVREMTRAVSQLEAAADVDSA
jgi:hypothetical protein